MTASPGGDLRTKLEAAIVEYATFESDAQRIMDAIWPLIEDALSEARGPVAPQAEKEKESAVPAVCAVRRLKEKTP